MADRPNRWSYSALSCYEKCPAQYAYRYIDRIQTPKAPALQRGIDTHKDVEDYVHGRRSALPKSLSKFVGLFEDLRALKSEHSDAVMLEEPILLDRAWQPADKETHWLKCVLDVFINYQDGEAEIIDHKTGKRYPTHADQMQLYAIAAMQSYEIEKVRVGLWYLDRGDKAEDIVLAKGLPSLVQRWDDRAGAMLAAKVFPRKPSYLCGWCDYHKSKYGNCPGND